MIAGRHDGTHPEDVQAILQRVRSKFDAAFRRKRVDSGEVMP